MRITNLDRVTWCARVSSTSTVIASKLLAEAPLDQWKTIQKMYEINVLTNDQGRLSTGHDLAGHFQSTVALMMGSQIGTPMFAPGTLGGNYYQVEKQPRGALFDVRLTCCLAASCIFWVALDTANVTDMGNASSLPNAFDPEVTYMVSRTLSLMRSP